MLCDTSPSQEARVSASRDSARETVTRIVEAYNGKDAAGVAALFHPNARYWSALGGWQEGMPAIKAHLEELHRSLPDEQMEPLAVVTDGDTVVVEFRSSGTAPSGNPYEVEFTEVIELRDGRIATVKVYLDPDEIERVTA
jgi:hypothetical protein